MLDFEQDTLGKMWFSTTRGVVYPDGIQTYELPVTLVRRFNYRISFLKDEEGFMWLFNTNAAPVLFKTLPKRWKEIDFQVEVKSQYSSGISFFSFGKGTKKYFF